MNQVIKYLFCFTLGFDSFAAMTWIRDEYQKEVQREEIERQWQESIKKSDQCIEAEAKRNNGKVDFERCL